MARGRVAGLTQPLRRALAVLQAHAMRAPFAAALLGLLLGCSDKAPPPTPKPTTSAKPQPAAAKVVHAAGGIVWDSVAPLVRREPKSPVRAAEYGVEGGPKAELVVFHFGEEKVSVEGQIQGWLIQVEQPDGSDTAKKAKRAGLTVGPLELQTVEVSGIYTGPVAMPGVQLEPERDWLLLGAIVSGPKGPVMFKLTGPRASVEHARPAFEQLLHSVRPG